MNHQWWSASKGRMVVHDLSPLDMETGVRDAAWDALERTCTSNPCAQQKLSVPHSHLTNAPSASLPLRLFERSIADGATTL